MILCHVIACMADLSLTICPFRLKPFCCFLKQLSKTEYVVRTCQLFWACLRGFCAVKQTYNVILLELLYVLLSRCPVPDQDFKILCMSFDLILPLHDSDRRASNRYEVVWWCNNPGTYAMIKLGLWRSATKRAMVWMVFPILVNISQLKRQTISTFDKPHLVLAQQYGIRWDNPPDDLAKYWPPASHQSKHLSPASSSSEDSPAGRAGG